MRDFGVSELAGFVNVFASETYIFGRELVLVWNMLIVCSCPDFPTLLRRVIFFGQTLLSKSLPRNSVHDASKETCDDSDDKIATRP